MSPDVVTPHHVSETRASILVQLLDAGRAAIGLQRDAARQALEDRRRASQSPRDKATARDTEASRFTRSHHGELKSVQTLLTSPEIENDLELRALADQVSRRVENLLLSLESIPRMTRGLTEAVKNAETMQDLVDAEAALEYYVQSQCALPSTPGWERELPDIGEHAERLRRRLATLHAAPPRPAVASHPARFTEVDFTRPESGPRSAITDFDIYKAMSGGRND